MNRTKNAPGVSGLRSRDSVHKVKAMSRVTCAPCVRRCVRKGRPVQHNDLLGGAYVEASGLAGAPAPPGPFHFGT
jgi:hypothetical protein